ncbi:MAG: hypothetical protein QF877_17975 [Gammaproteobacteria bacterium]|jgi:hypothetical protein|nr:hypothetical protein [Gammaproteobacteria bacterium]
MSYFECKRSFSKYLTILSALVALALTACTTVAIDRDDNPPGPAGGPGTNWENPPGPKGGVGASPDVRHRHTLWLKRRISGPKWSAFISLPPKKRYAYCHKHGIPRDYCWFDRDNNPPGPKGGPGTNWENPPGPKGGPGVSPD